MRLKTIAVTGGALAAIAVATPLAAQRSDPPVVTAPEIQFTQWKLANGLTVIALPDPTTATVTTSMWYEVGAKNDPEGRSGFAHLFEHILNRKTENMPYGMINQLAEDIGGSRNASTGYDRTNYYETVPAQYLETLLWTHAERMAAYAQDPAAAPAAAFEVASVKPSNPNPDPSNPLAQIALMMPQPGGRFTATNTPLRMLIMAAFALKQEAQLVGGTPDLLAAKYDITARATDPATIGKELPQLLRSLLAERFKLKSHTESRELPLYDLVLARSDGRLGPNLRPSQSDCSNADKVLAEQGAALAKGDVGSFVGKPKPCSVATDPSGGPLNLMLRADGQEMKQLVEILSQFTGRAVRDKTGLTGRYDFDMRLDLQMVLAMAQKLGANIPPAAANIPQADGTALTTVLNEQLGLKLESVRAPVDVVVIDSVEAATAD